MARVAGSSKSPRTAGHDESAQFLTKKMRTMTGIRTEHSPAGSAASIFRLQALAGNHAVSRLVDGRRQTSSNSFPRDGILPPAISFRPQVASTVQREFSDADMVAEDAPGYMRGPAGKPESASAKPERVNPFGLFDGEITSDVAPHAFTDIGQVSEGTWHHCGGSGGKGVENTGHADLVAPVFKTKAAKPGGQAKAWIKKGTGTVKVKRSFNGVTTGVQGPFTSPPAGDVVWMSPRGQTRVAKHEREHTKKTKELHKQYIVPLEDRISKYRGYIKAKKKGTDEATAQAALEAEIDWNNSIQNFANDDTAQNQPMGPVDQNDMQKADFYMDYPTSPAFKNKSGCDIYEGVGASRRKKT